VLGGIPVTIAFSETYMGLKQGLADAAENPSTAIYDQKWYEVAKYLAMTNHVWNNEILTMSKKTWEALTPEQRKIVQDTSSEVAVYRMDLQKQMETSRVEDLKKLGMQVVVPPSLDPYRKLAAESPEAHTLHYNLGLICFKLGRLEDALSSFLKALELTQGNPRIHFYLGSIYEKLQRYKDAIHQYRQAGANVRVQRLQGRLGASDGGADNTAPPGTLSPLGLRKAEPAAPPDWPSPASPAMSCWRNFPWRTAPSWSGFAAYWSMRSSITWRKWVMRPWIGQAAASPSAQIVWPSICLVTSSSMSISRFSARPSAMRVITRHIQPVPSRQGVHWPQDSCL